MTTSDALDCAAELNKVYLFRALTFHLSGILIVVTGLILTNLGGNIRQK